jgi:predicted PurR-regulated permease PerM
VQRSTPRRFLLFLIVTATALAGVIVWPFWAAFFVAAVLAAALSPWMRRLSRRLGGRRNVAAGILAFGVLVALVLPVASLGTIVVGEIVEGVASLRTTLDQGGVWGLVRRLPDPIEGAVRKLLSVVPNPQRQLQDVAGAQGGEAAKAVGGVLAATGNAVFQTTMMLIALFFFLVDGRRLLEWVGRALPLPPTQFHELVDDFRRTSVAVLVSTVGTAAVQAVVATVGYLIARAPNTIFLAVVTFVVALIPAVGGAVVVVAAALLQLAAGHPVSAVFLAIWGIGVVSLADNFARPYLMKGGMELHGGVIFFALLGGLAVFGGVGIIVGPLVTTFLVAVVRLYRRDYGVPAEDADEEYQRLAEEGDEPRPPLPS